MGVLTDGDAARNGDMAELDRLYMNGDMALFAEGDGAVGNAENGSTSDNSIQSYGQLPSLISDRASKDSPSGRCRAGSDTLLLRL